MFHVTQMGTNYPSGTTTTKENNYVLTVMSI